MPELETRSDMPGRGYTLAAMDGDEKMAAAFGTVEIIANLDASRALVVIEALDMMNKLLQEYGHVWTEGQRDMICNAATACTRENLVYSLAKPS